MVLNAKITTSFVISEYDSNISDNCRTRPFYDRYEQMTSIKEQKLAEFEKKVTEIQNHLTKIKLVIELMMTKSGKSLYRLADNVLTNF